MVSIFARHTEPGVCAGIGSRRRVPLETGESVGKKQNIKQHAEALLIILEKPKDPTSEDRIAQSGAPLIGNIFAEDRPFPGCGNEGCGGQCA